MSILSWKIMPGSQRSHKTAKLHEYEYSLIIVTKTATNAFTEIENDPRMPRGGSGYPGDAAALLTERDINRIDERVWTARLFYTTERDAQDESGKPQKPEKPKPAKLLKPPTISWGERTVEVFDMWDKKGFPYVNRVGELIAPPPAKLKSIGILTVATQQKEFNLKEAKRIRNKVNKDFFYGCAANTLLAKQPTAVERAEENPEKTGYDTYWEVTYTFENDDEGWIPTLVLNVGNKCYYSNPNAPPQYILGLPRDDMGREYDGQVMLDNDGTQITVADIVAMKKKPFYLYATQYETYNFHSLGIE